MLLRVRGHCDIIQMLQRNPFCLKERRFIIRENKGDVKIYEIRYRNSAAYFHISLYLYVTPQTRMVTAFLKIATL